MQSKSVHQDSAATPHADASPSATPRVDAFTTSLYNNSCAANADVPGYYATEVSPEEAYGLAVDFAQRLERENAILLAALQPFGAAYDKRFADVSPARADWYTRMNGSFPCELTVTVSDCRAAHAAIAKATAP